MTFNEFIERFHIRLNEQQLSAVKSVSNPTLLLAVPGSGKTTVLVTRLGYMVYCCGIEPEHILTVTYTVAATKDMQQRFACLFGNDLVNRLEFRTINGICAKIIGYYGNCVGKKAYDLVTNEGYKTKLISAIYLDLLHGYPTESDLRNLSTQITYIKNRMLEKSEIEQLGKEQELPLFEIYMDYCQKMRTQSLMDYDDQMVYALTILQKAPGILTHFQDIYQYICVDEAQDTSKIQHEIIRILTEKNNHIFMVGDEDQSIYGFRAAYPEALLDFDKNYSNAQVLLMEENFRSNAKIVSAADQFIQKNEYRHKKTMKASRDEGMDIQSIALQSRKGQYPYLVKVASDCKQESAVLYRDNESILPVIDLLERKEIPYRIRNADFTFFFHRVVVDIQNIILFARDLQNTDLFMQIYYKIGLYMNKAAAMEACRNCEERDISVLDAALLYGKISPGTKKSVKAIQTHLQGLLRESADKAVYRIAHFMGYGDYLEKIHMKDGKIQILEAIGTNEPSALRLVERLNELSVLIKEKKYDSNCRFTLSTIHASKGLEYDRVYLMDVKDGVFPENVIRNRKKASIEELKIYEEERRLFYVGITRAKNSLCMFDFQNDSTFSRELFGRDKKDTQIKGSQSKISMLKKKTDKRIVSEAEYFDKLDEIQTTGYVKHTIYGEGKVLSIVGDNIVIAFQMKTAKCRLKFMMEHELIE
ncbi:MAG TPA: ATP-dependent helicase [Lachnospiraceae bacterium]|nr:ATP-dependent helicase [Lachnospiraceae bacterium]